MLTNLLSETKKKLELNGKTTDDVRYVTDRANYCSWEHFVEIANKINYDNGYGGAEINSNLAIVGDDWWLERREYDGAEWWYYCQKPEAYHEDEIKVLSDF